jgi:aerobic-type carbon monoxide dehydrogenase small subunit (CoxS/CutS family)
MVPTGERRVEEHGIMARVTELTVNGAPVAVDVDAATPLLSVLREDLGLTGSKIGCGEGECGACTVLAGDRAVRACITPVGTVADRPIVTIEGLAQDGRLHPLQQAFLDTEAFQCGYCTPGMIMAGLGLLTACPNPTEAEIVAGMQGNICRCGTYRRIIRAIQQAAEERAAARAGEAVP